MNDCFSNLGRCISIFDRLMKMYYDHGLSAFEIGWGQQFYVEYLYDHPGASPQENLSLSVPLNKPISPIYTELL